MRDEERALRRDGIAGAPLASLVCGMTMGCTVRRSGWAPAQAVAPSLQPPISMGRRREDKSNAKHT
jgi:hypothetical protein